MSTADELAEARELIAEQDAFLKQITEGAQAYGTVVDFDGPGKVAVANGEKIMHVNYFEDVKIGDAVRLVPDSGQILGFATYRRNGPVGLLERPLDDGRWEITLNGTPAVAIPAEGLDGMKIGDMVLLDRSGSVFFDILPRRESEFAAQETDVSWDDIGGNDDAKRELREAIDLLRGGNDVYSRYGAEAPKGLLFWGPPGCGKTMLGRAAATELAGDGAGAFLYVKGPELLNMYVGQTEAKIRSVFHQAQVFKQNHGQAPILFIDEADAILQTRGHGISSDIEKTIVPTFLTEMDGMDASSALVILATNRADTLDPAVVRDGRIDRKIKIDRPGPEQAFDIFTLNLRGLPLHGDTTAEEIAGAATETMFQEGSPLASRVSGAMVAGVVGRAKRRAIRREIELKRKTGLELSDVTASILEAGMEAV